MFVLSWFDCLEATFSQSSEERVNCLFQGHFSTKQFVYKVTGSFTGKNFKCLLCFKGVEFFLLFVAQDQLLGIFLEVLLFPSGA